MTTEDFIKRAIEIQGNKYDYSKVEYYKCDSKICIICPKHGEFWQTPNSHLNGSGCSKCSGTYKPTTEEFIEKLKEIFGNKYDYSNVEYKNAFEKVHLICPIHGDFWIRPHNLLQYEGCKKCGTQKAQTKNRMKQEEFIQRASTIHNNKYDYSISEYKNSDTKVCIICPEHGEFWQSPHHHLNGIGCPKCGRKDITETKLFESIKEKYPDAIHCYRPDFLYNNGKPQSLDIFIPSLNVAIEYQGRQHFIPVSRYGGEKELENTIRRDQNKFELCKQNNLRLLYVSFEKEAPNSYLSTIYKSKEELFDALNNG